MHLLFTIVCLVIGIVEGTTVVGFYSKTCPQAETIVRETVESHFNRNPAIAPGLLRMHFHDCFVRGCDASVLITGPNTESTAPPNLSLRGFEVIDEAKAKLEAACPKVVSCADILALAARDSVHMTKGMSWPVPTGRRDGRISIASEANTLPGPAESVDSQKQKFAAKGLNTVDLVTLVGGHTIGTAQCFLFSYRLYNYNNTGKPDPSINSTFLAQLQALCPQNGNGSRRVALDTGSEDEFDASYYENLKEGRGILESDQLLWNDAFTRAIIKSYLSSLGYNGTAFKVQFGKSMIKMGNIGVKTGTDGEIRKGCSAIN